jgi:penicillin-binding protein 2
MDVVLTIDLDLQVATDAAIGDKVGSAVVLDPNNGQVLAMASRPTFDPNVFVLGISDEEWARLNDPVALPLVNRATLVGYPTGSVFKVVTASAGMAHLGLTADSWFNCPGTFSLEGSDQTWADWIPGGQGEMNLHRAIYRSCNTVFYQIGAQLDEQNEMWLPDMVRAFGFGARSGLQELYDIPGVVPDPAWKQEVVGDFWARGDAVNLSIGQGYFLATPLQVAKAYAAITNGGTLYRPYMVMDVVRVDGSVAYSGQPEEMGKLPLNGDQIAVLKAGMYDVIHAGDGTAVAAFEGAGYVASGKTGTAETGVPGEAAHGWFGSFAPTDAPRITVVTMVEHGVAGSQSAAPVARRIMDAYFTLYP